VRALLLALAVTLAAGAPALAKKKPPKTSGDVKKEKEARPPAPDDKGTNEGGAGRRNATEDAARDAEGPGNATGHRP
jgi:hypothetical protein